MKKTTTITITIALSLIANTSSADSPNSFSEAKRLLYSKVYFDHSIDQYCGCSYDTKRRVDAGSCGLQPRRNAVRAMRIEAEHIVPMAIVGKQRRCWQQGGRKNCEASDPEFNRIEADLYNLMPVVGELNSDRGDLLYGEIPGEPRTYGACNFEVDFELDITEPPDAIQGDAARTWLYFRDRYGIRLSSQQEKLFDAWSKRDPVDKWECTRARRIANIQGWENPYITPNCSEIENATQIEPRN